MNPDPLSAETVLSPTRSTLQCRALGRDIANPVGLAAGLDPDGAALPFWAGTGAGFLEIGTVDPASRHRAAANLAAWRRNASQGAPPVGVNIGPSPHTRRGAEETAYRDVLEGFLGLADYLAVNLSASHTQPLRADRITASRLLDRLKAVRDDYAGSPGTPPALVVKAHLPRAGRAPEYLFLAKELGYDGVVAVIPDGLTLPAAIERIGRAAGELRPLSLIAVGGVTSPIVAQWFLEAGAAMVQLHRGVRDQGPPLIHRTLARLRHQSDPRVDRADLSLSSSPL